MKELDETRKMGQLKKIDFLSSNAGFHPTALKWELGCMWGDLAAVAAAAAVCHSTSAKEAHAIGLLPMAVLGWAL